MVPLVGKAPAKSLSVIFKVDVCGVDVKTFFLGLFVNVLDFEVDFVRKGVQLYRTAFVFVFSVRVYSNHDATKLGAIRLHICNNLRLIKNILTTDFPTYSVDFGYFRDNFLESCVDFPKLLLPLLFIQLSSQGFLHFLLSPFFLLF